MAEESPSPRSFDPVLVGRRECDAWAAYYRREWLRFLVAAVGMVRAGFGMPWPRTLQGAWLLLRANQLWAPYPDNDPAGAREQMRRFYLLVERHQRLGIDPAEAARREVSWWRVHREIQREQSADGPGDGELVGALAQLYAYVYSSDPSVRRAAEHRARAMHLSDAWVAAGCDPADPRLAQERLALVASYTALLDAVSRP
jgi:hypothetical protein